MRKVLIALCVFGYSAAIGCTGMEATSNPEPQSIAPPSDAYVSPLGVVVPIQDVGLPRQISSGSGVPPLGVGIAPSLGRGGDGDQTAQPQQIGGWSGGPGAVAMYGRQWIIPVHVAPGRTLANVNCDVWNPNTAAAVTVLVELVSSNGGALGSVAATASTSTVSRVWILPPAHQIADGEQALIRIWPRNAAGWTPASQPVTVISCAINTRRQHVYKLSALGGTNVGAGGFQVSAGSLTGNWAPVNEGDLLGVALRVQSGERLDQVSSSIYGNSAYTITSTVLAQDDAFHVGADVGNAVSLATNTLQPITIALTEDVNANSRGYWLQFRAHRVAPLDGGQPFVGPISLFTSSAD